MIVRWSFALTATAVCLALVGPADAAVSPELAGTVYELDCEPIGKVLPAFPASCKAARAKGTPMAYRFDMDSAGQWTVSPPLSGGSAGSQALKAVRFEGLDCLEAPFVLVCQVPRNTELFKSASPEAATIRSRSGLAMLATNLGAIDLKKVANNE